MTSPRIWPGQTWNPIDSSTGYCRSLRAFRIAQTLQIIQIVRAGQIWYSLIWFFLVRFRALCNGPPEPCQVRKEAALRG